METNFLRILNPNENYHFPNDTNLYMDNIEIKGYKSIKDAKITFASINLLIGANGSGKSNFLSFFEFLNNLYERNLKEYVSLRGGEDKMLHKGSKVTQGIYSKIKFDRNDYSFEVKQGEDSFIFISEGMWYDGNPFHSNPINISDLKSEANIKSQTGARANFIKKYLESFKKYHFHDTGRNSSFNSASHIENDIHYLYEKGENLAAFLFNIQRQDQIGYTLIIKTIQSIAPFFSDFYFNPNKEGFVKLQWRNKYGSTVYGASDLSDGTMRFIAMSALFLQPKLPTTIIIDEPELGLHPFAISKLAGMMQAVSSKKSQVIAATQSADLINHFTAHDIITVDQKDGASIFNRLQEKDLSEWLDDYSLGDLWQRNVIHGGQPNQV